MLSTGSASVDTLGFSGKRAAPEEVRKNGLKKLIFCWAKLPFFGWLFLLFVVFGLDHPKNIRRIGSRQSASWKDTVTRPVRRCWDVSGRDGARSFFWDARKHWTPSSHAEKGSRHRMTPCMMRVGMLVVSDYLFVYVGFILFPALDMILQPPAGGGLAPQAFSIPADMGGEGGGCPTWKSWNPKWWGRWHNGEEDYPIGHRKFGNDRVFMTGLTKVGT